VEVFKFGRNPVLEKGCSRTIMYLIIPHGPRGAFKLIRIVKGLDFLNFRAGVGDRWLDYCGVL